MKNQYIFIAGMIIAGIIIGVASCVLYNLIEGETNVKSITSVQKN